MLLNLTNHPFASWPEEQAREARRRWASVVDSPFPAVGADWTGGQLKDCADRVLAEVSAMEPDAVLCQGEMGLTCLLVAGLQRRGIPVYAATSDRVSVETAAADGTVVKKAVFRFVAFREYPMIGGV